MLHLVKRFGGSAQDGIEPFFDGISPELSVSLETGIAEVDSFAVVLAKGGTDT